MVKLRDSEWLRHIPKRVFGDDLVLRFAQDQPNGRLVGLLAKEVVDGREVEIHLAGVGWLEGTHLQVDHDEAAET